MIPKKQKRRRRLMKIVATKKRPEPKKKASKIRSKKTRVDGILFDSKTESDYYKYLKTRKMLKKIKGFSTQVSFVLQPRYIVIDNKKITDEDPNFDKLKKGHKINTSIRYIADFVVEENDGSIRVVDTKGGYSTDVFNLKRKMFNFRFPETPLDVICYDINKKEWVDFDTYKKEQALKKKEKKLVKKAECNKPLKATSISRIRKQSAARSTRKTAAK